MKLGSTSIRPNFELRPTLDLPVVTLRQRIAFAAAALPAMAMWPAHDNAWVLSLQLATRVARWLLVFLVIQRGFRMKKQMRRLVPYKAAACDGSLFRRLPGGVELHYTQHEPHAPKAAAEQKLTPITVHFNHGLGSNCFTWDPLFYELGEALSSKAYAPSLIAHDRCGFGLSSRPSGQDDESKPHALVASQLIARDFTHPV